MDTPLDLWTYVHTMNNTGAAACVGAPSAGVSKKICSASDAEMRSVLVWVDRVRDREKNSLW